MPDPFSINDMINNFQDNILPAIAPMMGGISDEVNIPAPEVNINNDAVAIVNNGQGYVDTTGQTQQPPQQQQPIPQQPLLDVSFTPSSVPGYFLPSTLNTSMLPGGVDLGGVRGYTLAEIQAMQGAQGLGLVQFDLHDGQGYKAVQTVADAQARQQAQAIPGGMTGMGPNPFPDIGLPDDPLTIVNYGLQQEAINQWILQEQARLQMSGVDKNDQRMKDLGHYSYVINDPNAGYAARMAAMQNAQAMAEGKAVGTTQNVYGQILPSGSSGGGLSTQQQAQAAYNTDSNLFGRTPSSQDQRLIMGSVYGTPLYQLGGTMAAYSPEVQATIDKINRWNGLTAEEKLWHSNDPTWYPSNEEKIVAMHAATDLPSDLRDDYIRFMQQMTNAQGQALINENPLSSQGYNFNNQVGQGHISGNSAMAQLWYGQANPNIVLPEGDQLGRMLVSAAHLGVLPSNDLLAWANSRDAYLGEIWNPGGVWNTLPYGVGSMEGLAGTGSGTFYSGLLPGQTAYTGNADPLGYFGLSGSTYSTGTPMTFQNGQVFNGPLLPGQTAPPQYIPPASVTRNVTGEILGSNKGIYETGIATQPNTGGFGGGNQNFGFPGSLEDLRNLGANGGGSGFVEPPTVSPYRSWGDPYGSGGNLGGWRDNQIGNPTGNYPPLQNLGSYIQDLSSGNAQGTSLDSLAPESASWNERIDNGGGTQNMATGFGQGILDAYYGYNGNSSLFPQTDVFGQTGYGPATNYVHFTR